MRVKFPPGFVLKCLVCAIVLAGCGMFKKGDPAQAADDFFKLLAKGKIGEAYESTAIMYQMQINVRNFEAIIRDMHLDDYASSDWKNKTVGDREVRLDGEIAGTSGAKLHVVVTMVEDSGRWRLFSLLTPAAEDSLRMINRFGGVGNGNAYGSAFTRPMPDEKQIRQLIAETMERFNQGLHKQDFAALYASISTAWQEQTTKGQMELAFKHFIYDNIKIDGIENTEPIFDEPPRLNSEGVLVLSGHYPTKPEQVVFELKYVYELPKWKLLGITVTMK